jgi:hypothetical protein
LKAFGLNLLRTSMKRLHIADAQAQGYTIDNSAAGRPWAYKGPRFNPTASCECYTELETQLMTLVPVVVNIASSMKEPLAPEARTVLANLSQDIVLAAQAR